MPTTLSRDQFLLRTIQLGSLDELDALLASACELLVDAVPASSAYLELFHEAEQPRYWAGHGAGLDLDAIRARLSRGIIGMAIARGQTVVTDSACDDERFHELGSVRQHQIRAVLCVPFGLAVGVLYVERATGTFDDADRERAEILATLLAPLAERLQGLLEARTLSLPEQLDALKVRRIREALDRNRGNIVRTARELGIARGMVHRALRRPAP